MIVGFWSEKGGRSGRKDEITGAGVDIVPFSARKGRNGTRACRGRAEMVQREQREGVVKEERGFLGGGITQKKANEFWPKIIINQI